MKQDCENPWKVSAIEDFQFFCCPECDSRNHSKDNFLTHALETHPDAKEALKDILGICAVIEVKSEEIDEDLGDFEQKSDLGENNEPEESIEDIPEDHDDDFYSSENTDVKETIYSILPNFEASIETKSGESEAKSFPNESSLQSSGSSAFSCKTCKVTFSSLAKLVDHKLSVHGSGDEKKTEAKPQQSFNKIGNPNQTFRQPGSSTKYVKKDLSQNHHQVHSCKFCNAKYASAADLKKHLIDRHKMVMNNPNLTVYKTESGTNNVRKTPISTEFFHCEECNLEFSMKSSLTKHLKAHHSHVLHPCKLCKASFGAEADLEKHALEKHKLVLGGTKGDSFQCATCNAQFMTSMQLKAHQFSQHKKVEVHSCHFCGKTFTKNFGLRLHIRKFHEKDQSEEYTCEFCGKKFVSNFSFRVLMVRCLLRSFIFRDTGVTWLLISKANMKTHGNTFVIFAEWSSNIHNLLEAT